MRWTCELPVAVCQFFTSSLIAKSADLSFGMTCSLAGARIFTVGRGAAGSGLAVPAVSVTGAGGGAGGGASTLAEAEAGGAAAVVAAGGGAGGGGGGGRLSLPPPHANARTAGATGSSAKRVLAFMGEREHRPGAPRAQRLYSPHAPPPPLPLRVHQPPPRRRPQGLLRRQGLRAARRGAQGRARGPRRREGRRPRVLVELPRPVRERRERRRRARPRGLRRRHPGR